MSKINNAAKDFIKRKLGKKIKKAVMTVLIPLLFKGLIPVLIGSILMSGIAAIFTMFSFVTDVNTSLNNPKDLRTKIDGELGKTIKIAGDDSTGYYYEFVDNIDEILENHIEEIKTTYGYHIMDDKIKDKTVLKKFLKAEFMTQLPDLGGAPNNKNDEIDISEILENMTLSEKIEQMLLITIDSNGSDTSFSYKNVGGYVLNGSKFDGIENAIKGNNDATITPFYATDDEGGEINRVLSGYPGQREYNNDTNKITEDFSKKAGELKEKGINLLLAPDADVTNEGKYMASRSFGSDTNKVASSVEAAVKALKQGGMASVLKHYPGYGDATNTHEESGTGVKNLEPFKKGINASEGSSMVMVGHVQYDGEELPASFSQSIHDELKKFYNGVIITDDVGNMEAAEKLGEDRELKALQAGNDMIMTSESRANTAKQQIETAVNEGKISEDTIDESVKKILTFKKDNEILSKEQINSSGSGVGVTTGGGFEWPVKPQATPQERGQNVTSIKADRLSPGGIGSKHHQGMDIACPTGTEIVAATSGTVEVAGSYFGYGYAVKIKHDGQINGKNATSIYGHNSQVLVSVGQHVNKGDLIALAGSTGHSTGPHCHFQVNLEGEDEAIDPLHLFTPDQVNSSSSYANNANPPYGPVVGDGLYAGYGGSIGSSGKKRQFGENQFQGSIVLRRVSPDKRIGSTDSVLAGEAVSVNGEKINTESTDAETKLQFIQTWEANKEVTINTEAVLYDCTKKMENGEEKKLETRPSEHKENGKVVKIPKNTKVTYTGNYMPYTNALNEKTAEVYVEIKYEDKTGYVKSTTIDYPTPTSTDGTSNNSVASLPGKIKYALSSTGGSDKKLMADNAGNYVVALSVGQGTSNQEIANVTEKVAEKVKREIEKEYKNVTVEIIEGETEKEQAEQAKEGKDNKGNFAENAMEKLTEFFTKNENQTKEFLYINIQLNTGGGSGTDSIYKEEDGVSMELAEYLSAEVSAKLGLTNNQAGTETDKLGGTTGALMNSVESGFASAIVRGGYIDGAEADNLKSEEGIKNYALGIKNAIEKYFKSDHEGYEAAMTTSSVTTNAIKTKIVNLHYVPKEKYEQIKNNKPSSVSDDPLDVFTFDVDEESDVIKIENIITTSWSAIGGVVQVRENSPINITEVFKKYTTPFEYFMQFYIDMDYRYFSEDLADEIIKNSEFVVALQDNTNSISTNGSLGSETCTTSMDVTYAKTWFIEAYKHGENQINNNYSSLSFDSASLGMIDFEPISTNVEGTAERVVTKDEKGNETITQTCKYATGETVIKGRDGGTTGKDFFFGELYKKYELQYRARPDFINYLVGNDERTAHLRDITKYMFYLVSGINYGVTEIEFEKLYQLEHFDNINLIAGFGMIDASSTEALQTSVWFYLLNTGLLSKEQIAGIMGNITQESSWNPAAMQSGTDTSGGIGLIQWDDRKDGLKKYAASKGTTWQDPLTQLEFLIAELTPGGGANGCARYELSSTGAAKWASVTTPEDAAEIFCTYFERAGIPNMPKRKSEARMFYDKYKDMQPPSMSAGGAVYYQADYANVPFGSYGTLASDGCGPTSMAMCISDLTGQAVDPPTAWNWCNGAYATGAGVSWDYFGAAAMHFGLHCEELQTNSIDVIKALQQGKKVISAQSKRRGSPFPVGSGHIIYLTGIDSSGRVSIKDPNKYNADKVAQTWDPSQIVSWSANNWAIWK